MSLSHTGLHVGSYQENTESAVEKFRHKHNIAGPDMTVYNKKTAVKLGEIARKLRWEGNMYI